MDPAQIIQLYDATFVLPNLPEGVEAELVGAYGSGTIVSGQQTRVMGSKHKVRYTYGKEYIELADEIDLEESTYVRLGVPDMALVASILPSYTVSFDSGGGNPILPIANVKQGMRISSPIKPMRTGYTFEGWYKESSLVNEWDFAQDTVLKDMTLYAKWQITPTLSFNANGGSGTMSSLTLGADEEITLPANSFVREGYSFVGWAETSGGAVEYGTETKYTMDSLDVVLYAKWMPYGIGVLGPSGGYIFYDKGSYSDGWRYLEAAPSEYEFSPMVWGGHETSVGGTGTAIGTGKNNTEKIVARFGTFEPYRRRLDYAAKRCANLVVTKDKVQYDDWFLPSKDELNQMYQNLKKKNLGDFSESGWADGYYWSSSEGSANYHAFLAWAQFFPSGDGSGTQIKTSRNDEFRVRPVRAF
jgi:uncharacterized repeat protein (TIGR02543 family)